MYRTLTVVLACLGMAGALAIDTYLPSMPAIGRDFGVGPVAVQQTLSVFLFCFAFMMLFYGTLSDSFGRRRVILVSLVLYTIGSVGAAFAPSFGWLLAFRALQGLSAGAGSVVGQAVVQDRLKGADAQKMMSHIMMVFGLAPAIAPIVGGWLHVHFGWRSTFIFLAVFGALLIAMTLRLLPESLPVEKRQPFHPGTIARNYGKVLRHPQFLLLSLSVGMAFGGLSLYIGSAANFVMVILGLPETAFAWMFIPLIGGMVAGSAWGGKRAANVAPARMKWIGFGTMLAAAVLNIGYNAFFPAAIPWAVLPLAIYTFGLAVAMPAIQMSALGLFPDNRGLASSMLGFIQMMSFALVSGLVAPLLFDSAFKLACGVGVGLLLSFGAWRVSRLA
ncbi:MULTISPECIES: multidrug effflux MFS transporter [unclassified Massilia]|uniref:multidrug effflux MFS transporter n=1 Tax=unclassified Massilia TaxID=2609279 RepID=UPI00177CF404|nr:MULTISPECIES: multidrug effflux MFS transporter [unclassified Massilia]MBD8533084.1 multidrug effflux MFS transporter [Massilia sp. CFBP 13647]MBD8676559.1 multidrug effflux MFS transporter [Massilia sp. CFBP 13721]